MNTLSKVFQYNNTPISFRNENGRVMINATEMAKPFYRRPAKWLELPSTQQFIETLIAIRKSDRLIETVNGVGTWMHEDVALEFARWLSPRFAIWCNDRIKELLTHGMTAMPETVEAMLANPDLVIGLATQLKAEREEKARLQLQTERDRPKVLFAESVAASHDSILIDNLAKVLKQNGIDIGGKRLFQYLRENGFLGIRGEYYNMPTQAAMNLGLFEIKMHTISSANSGTKIKTTTKVTPKGQIYFINHFLRKARAA